ncbi:MAG: DUF3040 domain-containing protein [Nitriliruptorales bacterium]|nr:DUF3040 domain-containing protein [Nitriliruptorales bacterium]
MPLSEHEQRILEEIERRLAEEDPRFVKRARRASDDDRRLRHARWSVVGFVFGFLLLFGLTFHFAFGVAGFSLMLGSVVIGIQSLRHLEEGPATRLLDRFKEVFKGRDHAS